MASAGRPSSTAALDGRPPSNGPLHPLDGRPPSNGQSVNADISLALLCYSTRRTLYALQRLWEVVEPMLGIKAWSVKLAETRKLLQLPEQRVNQSWGCYLWWCSLTLRWQTSSAVVHLRQKEMWTPSMFFCSSRRPLFPTSLSVARLDGSCTWLTTFCIQLLRAHKNN